MLLISADMVKMVIWGISSLCLRHVSAPKIFTAFLLTTKYFTIFFQYELPVLSSYQLWFCVLYINLTMLPDSQEASRCSACYMCL